MEEHGKIKKKETKYRTAPKDLTNFTEKERKKPAVRTYVV